MPATLLVSINSSWNFVNFRVSLIRSWIADGHRVVAAAPRDAYTGRLAKLGVEFRELPLVAQGRSPVAEAQLVASYVRLLRDVRPDVYLGFTIKPNVYGSIAARMVGAPVINNIAGLGIGFAQGALTGPIFRAMYRVALVSSSTVFFQNRDDMAQFTNGGIVKPASAVLLPGSGVDLARFAMPLPETGRSPVIFAMLSRLLRSKGVPEFVEAARRIRLDRDDARFVIAGIPDTGHADGIDAATIVGWAEGGAVDYRGSVDDVRTVLAEADCAVLPTGYPEGTPRSLLEAAAAGRALIGSDMPGVRDIVRAGVNGFMVPPRDADALERAMRAFLNLSADERTALCRNSRAIAEAEFDEARVIAAYRDAIARALSGRQPATT